MIANTIPILGSISSINLVAGAAILGNIGGYPIGPNAQLVTAQTTYQSLPVVDGYLDIAATGYIDYNLVSSTFPALIDGIPTAYQSVLGNTTSMTTSLNTHINLVLGSGDIGKFEQIFSTSVAFVFTNNQLIASTLNAANAKTTTGYFSQDNTITGGLSDLTGAFDVFADDFARIGFLINFEDLDNLGSPGSLLRQINTLSVNTPALIRSLVNAGLDQDAVSDVNTSWTLAEQKKIYQVMTTISGPALVEILKLLKVTTPGITVLSDLLNPTKIFPQSFNTLTAPTANGLRGIYIDSTGTVNSNLETQLPASVLVPLEGNTIKGITYSNLRQVIPPDQALANKALTAALQQVKTIFNTTGPVFSIAVRGLETNKGLNLINSINAPLPNNVVNYFTSTFAQGTGNDGMYLLVDLVGSPAGWEVTNAYANTTTVLSSMTSAGAFDSLTNTNGVYPTMSTTAAGGYTTFDSIGNVYNTVIPSGRPGAGTYTDVSESGSIQLAFDTGLTPAFVSAVGSIVSNNTGQVNQANSSWDTIGAQVVREKANLLRAGIVFADLIAGSQATGLVVGLPNYGRDVVIGGAAFVLESIATNTQGGQAIISTMRESRNIARLNNAGMQLTPLVEDSATEPPAQLSSAQYSVSEAVSRKII